MVPCVEKQLLPPSTVSNPAQDPLGGLHVPVMTPKTPKHPGGSSLPTKDTFPTGPILRTEVALDL